MGDRQRIVEAAVGGAVQWAEDGSWGYCVCPGATLGKGHAHEPRACKAFAGETRVGGNTLPPGVYCVHQVCASVVDETSRRIRSEIGKAKVRAADPRARASARPVSAPPTGSRTARTGNWGLSDKQGGMPRTMRTEVCRPLTQYARARMHTHEEPRSADLPSVPSTAVAAPVPPVVQPAKPEPLERPGIVTFMPKDGLPVRGQWDGSSFTERFTFNDKTTL